MSSIDLAQPADRPETRAIVAGVAIDLVEAGRGRPCLLLHDIDGIHPSSPFFTGLAGRFRLFAPWHPGFGHSETVRQFHDVRDLAIFYQAFLKERGLDGVTVIGTGFGGWIAAEVAAMSTDRLGALVLIGAVGLKVSGRDERDIADMHATPFAAYEALEYVDPANKPNRYDRMSDWEMWGLARSRETAAHLGWKPYMHNPSLNHWLGRVDIPTLAIWGERDGVTSPAYGEAYAGTIPGASFVTVPNAAHHPHVEQPARALDLIYRFLAGVSGRERAAE